MNCYLTWEVATPTVLQQSLTVSCTAQHSWSYPDIKVHGANMGPSGAGRKEPRWAPYLPHDLCYLARAEQGDYEWSIFLKAMILLETATPITRFIGQTCGPSGADRSQEGPMNFAVWADPHSIWEVSDGLYYTSCGQCALGTYTFLFRTLFMILSLDAALFCIFVHSFAIRPSVLVGQWGTQFNLKISCGGHFMSACVIFNISKSRIKAMAIDCLYYWSIWLV